MGTHACALHTAPMKRTRAWGRRRLPSVQYVWQPCQPALPPARLTPDIRPGDQLRGGGDKFLCPNWPAVLGEGTLGRPGLLGCCEQRTHCAGQCGWALHCGLGAPSSRAWTVCTPAQECMPASFVPHLAADGTRLRARNRDNHAPTASLACGCHCLSGDWFSRAPSASGPAANVAGQLPGRE